MSNTIAGSFHVRSDLQFVIGWQQELLREGPPISERALARLAGFLSAWRVRICRYPDHRSLDVPDALPPMIWQRPNRNDLRVGNADLLAPLHPVSYRNQRIWDQLDRGETLILIHNTGIRSLIAPIPVLMPAIPSGRFRKPLAADDLPQDRPDRLDSEEPADGYGCGDVHGKMSEDSHRGTDPHNISVDLHGALEISWECLDPTSPLSQTIPVLSQWGANPREGEQLLREFARQLGLALSSAVTNQKRSALTSESEPEPEPVATRCAEIVVRETAKRRSTDNPLRDIQDKFQHLFDSSLIGLAFLNTDGVIVQVNRALCRLLERSERDMVGRPFTTLSHATENGMESDCIDRINSGEIDSFQMESWFIRGDGREIWGMMNISSGWDEQKRPKFLLVQIQDLSRWKQTELELQSETEHYQLLARYSRDAVISWNPEGVIQYVSPAAENVFQTPVALILGRLWLEFLHAHDLPKAIAAMGRALTLRQSANFEARWKTPDGRTIWSSWTVHPVLIADTGELEEIHCNIQPIADRKQLAKEKRFLELLIQNINESVIALDETGKVVLWNREAERIYGRPASEVVGKNLNALLSRKDHRSHANHVLSDMNQGHAFEGEFLIEGRDGMSFPIHARNTPLLDDEGRLLGMIGVTSNISERKRLESLLSRLARLECASTLAQGVARNLNHILAPILVDIDDLRTTDDPARRNENLDRIASQLMLCSGIIHRALTFTTNEEPYLVRVPLRSLLEECLGVLAGVFPKSIAVVTAFDFDKPQNPQDANNNTNNYDIHVRGDYGQLQQAFMNVVINAKESMAEGGRITIGMHRGTGGADPSRMPNYPGVIPEDFVIIDIEDEGCGIPETLRERIFEAFFSTKTAPHSPGLGLSTARKILRDHSGSLTLERTAPQGSCFRIALPCEPPPPQNPRREIREHGGEHADFLEYPDALSVPTEETTAVKPAAAPVASVPIDVAETIAPVAGGSEEPRTFSILVADDEFAVREMIRFTLEAEGYRIQSASNGAEALAVWKARAHDIDAAIIDLAMPVLDGPAAIRELRQLAPDLPIIAISAFPASAKGRLYGETAYLEKPFSPKILQTTLHNLLPSAWQSTRRLDA